MCNPAVVGWECESVSHSVVSDSLQPHGLYSPWNSPGQNTGVGSLSLLQGIFPTQGLNPDLLHCRQILYPLLGSVLIHGRLICVIVLFKSCISLLIFRLAVPHVIESGVLKSSTTLAFPFFFFSVWVACSWVFPLVLWKAYVKMKKNFFSFGFYLSIEPLTFFNFKIFLLKNSWCPISYKYAIVIHNL